jgi:two-component system sensor histidine kinase AtoS
MKNYSNKELVNLTRQIVSGKLAGAITHKAKNILMPLTGYVELIEKGVSLDKQKGYFKKIDNSGRSIQLLLKRFLRFSRPSQERIEEEINLLELIDEIISLFENYMAISKVTLEKDTGSGRTRVTGIHGDISLIIASILLNAIESSPKSGRIKLCAEVIDNKTNISIEDDGGAVGEEIKDKIFEPFFSMKKGSLGIGLTASLFLAKEMGGDLILKDKNKFVISLPC